MSLIILYGLIRRYQLAYYLLLQFHQLHMSSANKISKSPNLKIQKSPQQPKQLSPSSKKSSLKPKTLSDLKPIKPAQKPSGSPSEKHQKSFSGLYSKFSQPKLFSEGHETGYSLQEIKEAVNFIFSKYDKNKDNFLDRNEVRALIQCSLIHIGTTHKPSELQIIEFIYSMDKNSDGKLSRAELQNAFKRANRIDY